MGLSEVMVKVYFLPMRKFTRYGTEKKINDISHLFALIIISFLWIDLFIRQGV
jgi:hypothetical protein